MATENTTSVEEQAKPASSPAAPGPRPRGRPPKNQALAESDRERITKDKNTGRFKRDYIPLPRPGRMNPHSYAEMHAYWTLLWEQYPDRVIVYVYRKWPVIDKTRTAPVAEAHRDPDFRKGRGKIPKYIAKYTEPVSEEEFIKEHGSGTYRISINDGGLGENLMDFKEFVHRDMDNPPVLDINELVVSDPFNKDYVARLRRDGVILPGDADDVHKRKQQEESEMAENAAQSALVTGILSLADKVTENKQQQQPDKDLTVAAVQGVSNIMTRGLETIVNTMERMGAKDQPAPQSVDPMAMLERSVALIQAIAPKPAPQPNMAEAMAPLVNSLTESIAAIQSANQASMEMMAARITELARKPDKVQEPLELLRAAKALREELREEDEEKPAPNSQLPAWLPFAMQALQTLPAILQSMGIRLNQDAAPQQQYPRPAQPAQQNGSPVVAIAGPGAGPTVGGGGRMHQTEAVPVAAGGAPQAPDASIESYLKQFPPETQMLISDVLFFVDLIPRYLDQGKGGEEFAAVIAAHDEQTLEAMQGMGAESLMSTLLSLPKSGALFQPYPRVRIQRFVEEFCSATFEDDDEPEAETTSEKEG